MISIIESLANHLADMTALPLPIYPFQFPSDVVNCVALFPNGPGSKPGYYSSASGLGALDYPSAQIQVRYTDPMGAFYYAELIRLWLDDNKMTGCVQHLSNGSQPMDLTNTDDLKMAGGPVYRWGFNIDIIKVR